MQLCSQDAHSTGFCSLSWRSGPRTLGRRQTRKQFEQKKKKRTSFHFCHKIWSSSYTSHPPLARPPPPIWDHSLYSFQGWKLKTGASEVFLLFFFFCSCSCTPVYIFLLWRPDGSSALGQFSLRFPAPVWNGLWRDVEVGVGGGQGGRDEQLAF